MQILNVMLFLQFEYESTLARNDFLTFSAPSPSPPNSLQVRGCTYSFADLSLYIQIGFASAVWPPYRTSYSASLRSDRFYH